MATGISVEKALEVKTLAYTVAFHIGEIESCLLSRNPCIVESDDDLAKQVKIHMDEMKNAILELEEAVSDVDAWEVKYAVAEMKSHVFSIPVDVESVKMNAFKLHYALLSALYLLLAL